MISLWIKKKYKKVLDRERQKAYGRGHIKGCKVAAKEFQKQIAEVERKHKKEVEKIRHQLALQLQKDERFYREINTELLKMMA